LSQKVPAAQDPSCLVPILSYRATRKMPTSRVMTSSCVAPSEIRSRLGTWSVRLPLCSSPWIFLLLSPITQEIHFRCAEPPTANPDKYPDELLDAYLFVEGADALYAEYSARGVEFTRGLGNTPWLSREFVVKDCDGRLLAFGANL
jgi:hypothetical protein